MRWVMLLNLLLNILLVMYLMVCWFLFVVYARYEAELAAAAAQPLPDDDDADFES